MDGVPIFNQGLDFEAKGRKNMNQSLASSSSSPRGMSRRPEFTINLHHGGKFVKDTELEYVGGGMEVIDIYDSDKFSYFDLKEVLQKDLKYYSVGTFFYCNPRKNLCEGLNKLLHSNDVVHMINLGVILDEPIDVYVDHSVDTQVTIEGSSHGREEFDNDSDIEIIGEKKTNKCSGEPTDESDDGSSDNSEGENADDEADEAADEEPQGYVTQEPTTGNVTGRILEEFFLNDAAREEFYGDFAHVFQPSQVSVKSSADASFKHSGEPIDVQRKSASNGTEEPNMDDDSESDDPPYKPSDDSSDLDISDDDIEDESDDEIKEARRKIKDYKIRKKKGKSIASENDVDGHTIPGDSRFKLNDDEMNAMAKEMNETDSDGYPGTDETDDEDGETVPGQRNKKYLFNPDVDMQTVRLFVGLRFPNKQILRSAVRRYGIQNKFDTKFVRNEGRRISVACGNSKSCPWRIWASKVADEKTMEITVMTKKHECGKAKRVRQISSKFIATEYFARILSNPRWRISDMSREIGGTYKLDVGIGICRRAKQRVFNDTFGMLAKHYSKLWDYRKEIKRTNPGTSFVIEATRDNPRISPVFHRLYICFKALKDGFLVGCRKFLSLDGCFLKGVMKGQLLVAVGKDGNNQMWPVAWAVVQIENRDNWGWFLSLLSKDLDLGQGLGWIFMTDQQKGLDLAIAELLPFAEHRFCARHIYSNWKKDFKGLEYKMLFWRIARSTNENEYSKACEELIALDEKAYHELLKRPVEKWVKAFFSTKVKCDSCENNLVEGFNGSILEARTKPLVYMLEDLRVSSMVRIQRRKEWMSRHWDNLCPRIRRKLDLLLDIVRNWEALYNGQDKYQVSYAQDGYVVDLRKWTCSCRAWDLSGIPCVHALAAIFSEGKKAEEFVQSCFWKDTFKETYMNVLQPINGEEQWAKSSKPPILPPSIKKVLGRPVMKRRKSAHESPKKKVQGDREEVTREGMKMHCRTCGGEGHNARTCPSRDPNMPKTKVVRKKKNLPKTVDGAVETGANEGTNCKSASNVSNIDADARPNSNGDGNIAVGANTGSGGGKSRLYNKDRNYGHKKNVISTEHVEASTPTGKRKRGRPRKHTSNFQMKTFGVYTSPTGDTYYRMPGSSTTVHVEQVVRQMNAAYEQQSAPPTRTSVVRAAGEVTQESATRRMDNSESAQLVQGTSQPSKRFKDQHDNQ